MSDREDSLEDDSVSNKVEELKARHRKEAKELQGKIQKLKKSTQGDKKKKKQVTLEIAQMQAALDDKHEAELAELMKTALDVSGVAPDQGDQQNDQKVEQNKQPQPKEQQQPAGKKKSRAQQRREKKAQEERERAARIAAADPEEGESMREVEDAAIDGQLSAQNLKRKLVPADGNCLYAAVATQAVSRESQEASVESLRSTVADYIRSHKDDFIHFLTNDSGDMMNDGEFEEYCDKIATTTTWGGQCEITAMSHILNRPIKVFQANAPPQVSGEDYRDAEEILLSFHRHQYGLGEHYNAVVQS